MMKISIFHYLFLIFLLLPSCKIKVQQKAAMPLVESVPALDTEAENYYQQELKEEKFFKHYERLDYCGRFLLPDPSAPVFLRSIYGIDNRTDYCEMKNRKSLHPYAMATGMMIGRNQLVPVEGKLDEDLFKIRGRPLFHSAPKPLCNNVRFKQDMTSSFCSGFVLGLNIFVTARHCLDVLNWRDIRIVFPIREDEKAFAPYSTSTGRLLSFDPKSHQLVVQASQIYNVERIIWAGEKNNQNEDVAFLELSKDIDFTSPFKIGANLDSSSSNGLLMLGYPLGLSFKFNTGGVEEQNEIHLYTSLDAFKGNSGSPVIDRLTYRLQGILIRGNDDYVFNPASSCYQEAKYSVEAMGTKEIEKVLRLNSFSTKI